MTIFERNALLHDIIESVIQFDIDRFRGNEHQRQILRLSRDQVFCRDVGDVPRKVLPQADCSLLAFVLVTRFPQCGDRFQGELGVDHQRTLVGKKYRAIGTAVV
jgi:hypothetical protein